MEQTSGILEQFERRLIIGESLRKTRRWITVRPGGPGTEGHPVLIDERPGGVAHVIAGMGGAKGLEFLKLTNLKPAGQHDKDSAKLRSQQKRRDYQERLERKAKEYAGGQPVTREHRKQAQSHLKQEAEKHRAEQTNRYKDHVSKFADKLGMTNWQHNPESGISEHSHWRQAYRQLDRTYHRAKESLARDHELASGVLELAGQPMDYSDMLPDDAPAARGLGYQRTTRAEAAEFSAVPEVEAVRNALDHSEDAGRATTRSSIEQIASDFASSKLPSDQHYAGQLQEWLNKDFSQADGDELLQKVEEAAAERKASGLKTKRLELAPDPEREIQRDLKGMQSRDARKKSLEAAKKHKVQVGDQTLDAGTVAKLLRDHKRFRMEESDRRRGQDKGNLWGKGVHVDYTDMDVLPELVRDIHDEQTAMRNESFLHEVENAAKDPTQPNQPPKPGERLRQYLSEGTFHGLNYAAGTITGSTGLNRRAVDLLGVQGASELVANRIAASGQDLGQVRQALVNWHEQDHAAQVDEAMRQARESQQQAEDITIPPIHSADDVAVATELNRRRTALLEDAQATLGRTLGELESTAALIHALVHTPTPAADAGSQTYAGDPLSVDIPAGSAEAVARECHALGLTDDEFDLQPGDGGKAKLVIKPAGQDKLAQSADPEQEALYRDIQAIKRGDHDEDEWLPPGFARRTTDSLAGTPDSLPDLAFRQRLDLSGTSDPGAISQQVSDFVLAQYNNGRTQREIRDDLLSADFAVQHGVNERNIEAFMESVDETLPTVNPSEYAWRQTEHLRDEHGQPRDAAEHARSYRKAFREGVERGKDAERHNETRLRNLSSDFAQRVGGTTSALHDQSVDIDEPQVHEAAFRAIAAQPAALAAFRPVGMMSRTDRKLLRDHFWKTFAKEKEGEFEKRFTESTGGRHPGKDWQAFVREKGGSEQSYAAVQQYLQDQSDSPGAHGGGLFGDAPEAHPLASINLGDTASLVEAIGNNKHLLREGLATGDEEWKRNTHQILRDKAEHQLRHEFFTGMAGYKPHELAGYYKAAQDAAGDAWQRYVTMMGGEPAAYDALRHDLKGQFLEEFAKHHQAVAGKPLKTAEVELPGREKHQKGILPEDEARAAITAEQSKKASELARVAERSGGKFAGGERKEKAERLREAIKRGGQRALFSSGVEDEPTRAPATAKARAEGRRVSIGDRAEQQLGRIVEHVGKNFSPDSKGLRLYPDNRHALKQRMIKASILSKRMLNAAGTGSGKTAMGVGLFTTLHDQGKIKRGLYAVPSQVQGQYGDEINRFTEPGRYQFWAQPGASRAERIAAYKNPDNQFTVVTHTALRDDLHHLLAKNSIVPGTDETEIARNFNAAPREQRKQWVKELMDKEGMDFGLFVADEAHNLTHRRGAEGSGIANALTAIADNTPYFNAQTATPVRNEPSEIHSIMSFLRPDKYNDSTEADFLRRYNSNTSGSASALQREMSPHVYAEKIPSGVQRTDHVVDGLKLTPEQQSAYQQAAQDYQAAVKANDTRNWTPDAVDAMKRLSPKSFDGVQENEHAGLAERIGSSPLALASLRDSGFSRVVDAHPEGVKMQKLMDIVRKEREGGHPVVVFAHRREAVEQIRDALSKAGHRVAVLHGGMPGREKDKARLSFHPETGDPTADILVASDAGQTGTNLQRGSALIQLDTPMTSASHQQRQGRIDRLGQKNPVRFYDLVADVPYEHRARERLDRKYNLGDIMQSSSATLDDTGLAAHLNRVSAETKAARPQLPQADSLAGVAA